MSSTSKGSDDWPEPSHESEELLRSDERRRVARDLHDATSQLVALLQLQLGRLKRTATGHAAPLIEECEKVIREMHEQIRSLSRD